MKNIKPLKVMFMTAALAGALTGCGSDSDAADTVDPQIDPPITDTEVPPITNTEAELTVFADSVESNWSAWGEGISPVQVTDADNTYGEVYEFATTGQTVSGFSTLEAKGGSDVAYDASAFANKGTLDFDLKMTAAPSTNVWKLKVEGAGAPTEIDIDTPTLDTWVHYSTPLSSLGDMNAINNIMVFPNWADNANAVYRIDNVQIFATGAINSNSGGSLAIDVATGVDFEGAESAQASWETFENGDPSPSMEFVSNPDTTGNTSATVAKLNLAASDGGMYAGVKLLSLNTFALDASNAVVKIWVYKNKISPVAIKFEKRSGAAHPSRSVSNTLINQWEELTIDFTDDIGKAENGAIEQFAIFPDSVDGRSAEIIYLDNITFGSN